MTHSPRYPIAILVPPPIYATRVTRLPPVGSFERVVRLLTWPDSVSEFSAGGKPKKGLACQSEADAIPRAISERSKVFRAFPIPRILHRESEHSSPFCGIFLHETQLLRDLAPLPFHQQI